MDDSQRYKQRPPRDCFSTNPDKWGPLVVTGSFSGGGPRSLPRSLPQSTPNPLEGPGPESQRDRGLAVRLGGIPPIWVWGLASESTPIRPENNTQGGLSSIQIERNSGVQIHNRFLHPNPTTSSQTPQDPTTPSLHRPSLHAIPWILRASIDRTTYFSFITRYTVISHQVLSNCKNKHT